MAKYRNIQVSFWTDAKIADNFSPDEKFLYLYLMTNPHTSMCGCYEVSYRLMAFETGLGTEKVKKLIKELSEKKVLSYSETTSEVLLINWHKYNWTSSEKVKKLIEAEANQIKEVRYRDFIKGLLYGIDRVSDDAEYPIQNTFSLVSDINTDTVSDNIPDSIPEEKSPVPEYPYKEIVDYLNQKAGKQFLDKSKDTREHIRARFSEGHTLDDFFLVIDNMVGNWKADPKMNQYLRPSTLFGSSTKFENYMNMTPQKQKPKNSFTNFPQRDYDYDELERMLT